MTTSIDLLANGTATNVWSKQLKEILTDELDAQKHVDWMSEFPEGTTFNIATKGQSTVQDFSELSDVEFTELATGNFNFVINEYLSSAHTMTKMALQDSFIAKQMFADFVSGQARAISERIESDIFKAVGPFAKSGGGQTANDANTMYGRAHRMVAGGTGAVMRLQEFSLAKLALKKANVSQANLIAIVDPSVAYTLETATGLVGLDANQRHEGIVETGLTTGMRFIRNVYGFDVYESNYLESTTTYETIGTSVAAGNQVSNIFFSADSSVTPFKGAVRQAPQVDSDYVAIKQRYELITTTRYGLKLYRPENMVTVLSSDNV